MARTGRPRGFDRAEALNSAMQLFWEQGYESTSLEQLKQEMGGLSPASFYAAFGSKETLFREVVAHYNATHGQVTAPLRDETLAPREAIEQTLRHSARMQTDASHPTGCLIALSASAWSPGNDALRADLRGDRQANRDAIRACVDRAITAGELYADTDPAALATLFDGLLVGFAIQARDGVALEAMEAAITGVLGVWDAHGKVTRRGARLAVAARPRAVAASLRG